MWNKPDINVLLGKTVTAITGKVGDDEIIFTCDNGEQFKLYHSQDCCESVYVEDVIGDMEDLIGSPLLMAEEISYCNESPDGTTTPEYQNDSFNWTFYKFATIKGYVTIRWYGESNGYYSESVDFCKLD